MERERHILGSSSGDDAISNNTCYNDSGSTRTITAVKCRSDNGSNTTTVNPTFGSAGTGTTILSGALTCGNSYAYSSSGTVSNASWTTGAGIDPAHGNKLSYRHFHQHDRGVPLLNGNCPAISVGSGFRSALRST